MKDSWEDRGTRCPVWTWESEHLGKTSWHCAFCSENITRAPKKDMEKSQEAKN